MAPFKRTNEDLLVELDIYGPTIILGCLASTVIVVGGISGALWLSNWLLKRNGSCSPSLFCPALELSTDMEACEANRQTDLQLRRSLWEHSDRESRGRLAMRIWACVASAVLIVLLLVWAGAKWVG